MCCRLRSVPAAVLRGCRSLATLSLHGNPITIEVFREADGFEEFNARRCAKFDKQVSRICNRLACALLKWKRTK